MNKNTKILKLLNIGSYGIAILVVLVFVLTLYIRQDTVKRMNYSYNQMMETFPELNSIDMAVSGTFDSLKDDTLQLEMYQSFFRSLIYALPINEEISEERVVNYYNTITSDLANGWNKEIASTLESAMNTIHSSDILYGKEYVFNMQRDFVLGTTLPTTKYLMLAFAAMVALTFIMIRLIISVIFKLFVKLRYKGNNLLSPERKVSLVLLAWMEIGLLMIVILIPPFVITRNVQQRGMTNVINVVEETINKINADETKLFDNDKSFNIKEYKNSAWYVKRLSYELADYLLYRYKTTGDDSLLTQYCADLNDLDKRFASTVTTYVSDSKDNIDSFVPTFDTMENTVATEMLYSSFTTLEASNITNDWYNFENAVPTILFLYACSAIYILCIIGSEIYKSKSKEV